MGTMGSLIMCRGHGARLAVGRIQKLLQQMMVQAVLVRSIPVQPTAQLGEGRGSTAWGWQWDGEGMGVVAQQWGHRMGGRGQG